MELNNGTFLRSRIQRAVLVCGAVALMLAGGATAKASIRIADERAFFEQLDLDRTELAGVAKAVKAEDWDAAKEAWSKHLQDRTSPKWLFSWRDKKKIKAIYEKNFDGLKKSPGRADKVLRREFRFGGVTRTLPHDIDWDHNDYTKEWRNVLNRHRTWITLGQAWWQTGDSKYPEDWVYMLRDWIKDNPVDAGGRPWRSLEVGARANIWPEVMNLFMEAPAFDAEVRYLLTRSMVEHARFLYRNNAHFKKGNWQTTEAQGLASTGIMLPEFKESKAWRERGFSLMSTHMKKGVFPDGAQYELTPGYHYWVIYQFLKTIILAEKNGYELPGLQDRHEKMFEFLMHLGMPNRMTIAVGDAGYGKPIPGMMGLGALLYDRPDMGYLAAETISEDWVWFLPPEKLAAFQSLPKRKPKFKSHMMPNAKYGVMRTGWGTDDRWLLFDCAPWAGYHTHEDQLQVVIYSGRELLIDPGQVDYDLPVSKSYFKKAVAHNVLLLNGKGPNSNPKVVTWSVDERVELASAKVSRDGLTHQRSVLFVKPDYWVVVDHVSGKPTADLTRLFHLPVVEVERGEHSVQTQFKDGQNLWIGHADTARLEMREGLVRASVKTDVKAPVAALVSKHEKLPTALCTVLVPFAKPDEIPTLERMQSADPNQVSIKVSFKDGRTDWIAIAPDNADLSAGEHKGKGMALCVRSQAGKRTVDVIPKKPLRAKQ